MRDEPENERRRSYPQARRFSIGERRKPEPQGQPGYLRMDTVHQGNLAGHPDIYHID